MEISLYIVTGILTLGWSLSTYLFWEQHNRPQEDSPGRVFLILLPPLWFLLLILAGMQDSPLPLDLMGLLLYSFVLTLALLALGALALLKALRALSYRILLWAFNSIALLLTLLMLSAPLFPQVTIFLAVVTEALARFNFLSWLTQVPATTEGALNLLEKSLLALISYIPVAIFRMIIINFRITRMRRQLETLDQRVRALERQSPRA